MTKQERENKKEYLVDYIDEYFEKNLRAPSLREIEKETGITRGTTSNYLKQMEKDGVLEYKDGSVITEKMKTAIPRTGNGLETKVIYKNKDGIYIQVGKIEIDKKYFDNEFKTVLLKEDETGKLIAADIR